MVRILVLFIFILAISVRVANLNESRIIAERQYRSALIARTFYFEAADSVPDWRKEVALAALTTEETFEPPIAEFIVSWVYSLLGREALWVPRLFSTIYWAVGGYFLFLIAKKLTSIITALFVTAYYLFVPIAVHASISFLPDPLMIMMFLIALYAIVIYFEQDSVPNLIAAAVFSGLAVLAKPFCLFPILGAFLSLSIYKNYLRKRVFDVLAFLGLFLLLGTGYYLYGILVRGFLQHQAQISFLPQLILRYDFWKDWLLTASSTVGIFPLIAALVGIPALSKGISRALIIGLWLGYVVFGLVFTYHIRFASHYHLQLIVIVALSFSPIISLLVSHLRSLNLSWFWWSPVAGALILGTLFSVRGIRDHIRSSGAIENPKLAQEIGQIVSHSSHTIFISSYYGRPLKYFGELSGAHWPRSVDDIDRALGVPDQRSVEERLDTLEFSPEYFVITSFTEFNTHHSDLKAYLITNCSLVAETEQYLVYGACGR